MRNALVVLVLGLATFSLPLRAQTANDDLRKEIEILKQEIEGLRKDKSDAKPVGTGVVDKMVDNKYGPNATVTTKQGKLTTGGLLQLWYYNIENDNLGFFGDRSSVPGLSGDSNEGKDNDSYSIRRARVNFTMDIHENVTAFIQTGVEGCFVGRPGFGSNLGTRLRNATAACTSPAAGAVVLLDAYIHVHGLVPHHDSKIGQLIPHADMEGSASSAALDFVERSMIGQLANAYDVGSELHGTWLDDRLQYWLGVFNTPNDFLCGNNMNLSDTNDLKSFMVSVMGRPVWKDERWGSLELGASAQFNVTGESGDPSGTDGLNQSETDNIRYYGYASYAPGGPVKGWWLKGEYAWFRARFASNTWTWDGAQYVMSDTVQTSPRALDTDGWFVSTGYKLSDSIWADDLPWWLKPAEFTFRYETYGNIIVADLAMPNERHDVWNTSIYTAGLNYYIKGHNAKIQVNYNWVTEPDQAHDGGPTPRRLREVNNDNLVVNFQVAW